ncbi:hypothetical protein [Mesorhizobium sp.]|uniref:alpha/beta fold hydrolase n=1 Tax=Mesorhizobium sp. TaxID=1871066 RepID=UPI00257B5994|nr:hypothetical protein [Mesorhizobium sp.]
MAKTRLRKALGAKGGKKHGGVTSSGCPASPTAAAALARMNAGIDVRGVVAAICAPTLLIHRRNDAVDPDASRFLATKIANARLVEVPGRDHPIWTGDVERVADLIEELLTGERAVAEAERVLAALLATRINDTARLGDRMGSERNQRFQETWRLLVGRHGGSAAGMHGELMMSRFDSPARATRCAGALHEAAALCRVGHQPMEHLLHRGVAVLLAVTGRDADRRMRGGASLPKACAAPHPALRATFSRQRGEGRLPVRNHHMADGRVVFQGIE